MPRPPRRSPWSSPSTAPAVAAQPQVGLGTATPYAVLAGTTVTNTGPSVISGNVGVSPGTAITGFPPGLVNAGTIHAADAAALQAKNDLTTAYNDAAGRSPVVDETSQNLGGQTLVPGVYSAASGMALTGTVTLDAQGDPDAVFVFQAGSTLITASSSRVALIGGAQACNVFWQVGSSATHRDDDQLRRLGARPDQHHAADRRHRRRAGCWRATAQVTLDTQHDHPPLLLAPSASPSASPSATVDAQRRTELRKRRAQRPPRPTSGIAGGGNPRRPGRPAGGPGGDTPIPTGHPRTGQIPGLPGGTGWLMLGLLCLAGAGVAAVRGSRRTDLPES